MKGFVILALIINVFYPIVHTHDIFVYGTLKKGQPNYPRMKNITNGQADFLAHARTVERYPLVIGTIYNIPFLLNVPGKGHHVYGEIYRVDQTMLDFLDKFEECPEWYQRIKIQLKVQDGDGKGKNTLKPGSIVKTDVYIKTTDEPDWLQKPTYENYDTNDVYRMITVSVICPAVHMALIFIYGMLKKGQPNYFRMLDPVNGQAEFLAHARTVERYPLVIATKYNIPFLLNVPGTGHHVYGEIYRVDQKMLEFLDKFKGCPERYQRTKVQLEVQDGGGEGENTLKPGSIMETDVYIKTTCEPEWLQKPTYESYDTYGDHGLKYVFPEDRSPE
ncbi:gamma-glutamylaminecyclotransferase B-like protein [Labeo rohita]|uniref:Gamma-glutamylaminecyclotransferase n=1 Tax=Labeo rohita TaxID=84645 RepID=A0A498NCU2_LABRO|nr:gamma-glutamylaminecyclotransferase B-like protein [Labeo rohita]